MLAVFPSYQVAEGNSLYTMCSFMLAVNLPQKKTRAVSTALQTYPS